MKLGALGALGALAALSLLVVMIGPSEGWRISACDLKAELQKQIPRWWGTIIINQALCHAETLSGLNTALVRKCPRPKITTPNLVANIATISGHTWMETHGLRHEREVGKITDDPLPEEDDNLEEEQEGGDDGDEGGDDGEDSSTLSKPNRRSVRRRCRPGTGYYGIFQLSDRIYCDSGENPTMNLCRTSCSAFTDDDITDDIKCILQTKYWRHELYRTPHRCGRYRCPQAEGPRLHPLPHRGSTHR